MGEMPFSLQRNHLAALEKEWDSGQSKWQMLFRKKRENDCYVKKREEGK